MLVACCVPSGLLFSDSFLWLKQPFRWYPGYSRGDTPVLCQSICCVVMGALVLEPSASFLSPEMLSLCRKACTYLWRGLVHCVAVPL